MSLGEKLLELRKKEGLSQEEVGERLNVSRQTISKWETNRVAPGLMNLKGLAKLYNVGWDYLADQDETRPDLTSIEHIVEQVDWTRAWSKKYPILEQYQHKLGIERYSKKMYDLYQEFAQEYGFSRQDNFLALKDILYSLYKNMGETHKK